MISDTPFAPEVHSSVADQQQQKLHDQKFYEAATSIMYGIPEPHTESLFESCHLWVEHVNVSMELARAAGFTDDCIMVCSPPYDDDDDDAHLM